MSCETFRCNDIDGLDNTTESAGVVGVYLGGGKLKSGEYKALVKFNGAPTAAIAINALLRTPQVDRIVAAIPAQELVVPYISDENVKDVVYTSPGEKFVETILSVLAEIKEKEDAVVLFSDIPFVKSETIGRLIDCAKGVHLLIPAVSKESVDKIQALHNLHFMPCRNGYFHLGNAFFISHEAINAIVMNDLQEMYEGKSFRTNPKKKLKVATNMIGYEGFVTAVRIWLSANLQHKNLIHLDILIPSPSLADYERMLSRLIHVDSKILVGEFADLFLDYDYPDDAEQMQDDFDLLQNAFDGL